MLTLTPIQARILNALVNGSTGRQAAHALRTTEGSLSMCLGDARRANDCKSTYQLVARFAVELDLRDSDWPAIAAAIFKEKCA